MKSCKKGYYYCNTDKKCKPIPEGSVLRDDGFLMKETLDKKDKPFVKKLVGKLRKGSKTHAKQADDLEKAVNEGKKYKRDEYGDPIKPDGSYAGKKNEDKNPKDEKITRSEGAELPTFKGLTPKDADSSFIKQNGNKPKVTMRDKMKEIKNDPKRKKAKEDVMRDMNISDEYLNELSLDTLSQATRQAYSKREAARGTSEFIKRQRQAEKFSNAASKKRRELDATKDKLGKTFKGPDADRTPTMEEVVTEDDMKGMSVKSGHKRPTKSGAGMTAKGVAAYRRRNPGSKLQTAVTGKVKKGSKDAKRRKSYCARSAGQMKKFPKAAKDPNSRLRQARRRWKC